MDALYKRLLDFTRDGVYRYTWDDGAILMANQGLVDILGLDCRPEDLIGKRLRDVLTYTEQEGTVRRALAQTGEIHDFEYHFKTLSGEDKWVIHDSFVATDPATGKKVVEAIVKGITYRKRAEQAMVEEKERLAVTLRSIGDAVIATDTKGHILLVNRVAEKLTGWTQEEAVGMPLGKVFKIINEIDRAPCENPVEKVLRHGVIVGLANHTALISRNGREISIADSGAPIRDSMGRIVGVVLVFRDITEAKRAQEELKRRTLELEEKNAELDSFVYTVSHDLKGPLVTIGGFAQLLEERYGGQLDQTAQRYLAKIRSNVMRMKEHIDDLLDLSRVGRDESPVTEADLSEMCGQVLENLREEIRSRSVEVTVAPNLPVVRCHGVRMRQVLTNIIENAAKFMGNQSRPRIDVSAKYSDEGVRISVRDNGIGIRQENLDQIFEVFYRLPEAGGIPGTGVGLALVRRIVELRGGKVWAESTLGEGSTFHYTIPVGDIVRARSCPDAPEQA